MADEETNLADSTVNSANGPLRIRVEGMGESEEHPLKDQIAAAKFRPLNATHTRVGAGIRFTQATSGGAA